MDSILIPKSNRRYEYSISVYVGTIIFGLDNTNNHTHTLCCTVSGKYETLDEEDAEECTVRVQQRLTIKKKNFDDALGVGEHQR